MSSYLDPETEEFVEKYVGSFVAWDVIVYMGRHEGEPVSAALLADKLGRKRQEVAGELSRLERGRLLRKEGAHRYVLTQSDYISLGISRFIASITDRGKRLQILAAILKRRN